MSLKLRELIRQVRQCKSASAERAVIAKELAAIRTAIKDKNKLEFRHRNVAKLMYVDMLGYPTHFGQMEVVKMLASKSFVEKRLGYLALMQLLDENTEVLMLATQSFKKDMVHENPFIVGLALCAFGNIASTETSCDLSTDLCNVLKHNNPYIRKKAMCCAIRVVSRAPQLSEDYFKIALHTLEDDSMPHGPLIATVQLLIVICSNRKKLCRKMRKHSHHIINRLQTLLRSTYDADHDIGGVTDPFLQVKLLKLLRIISEGDKKLTDEMDSTLTTIATNTESNKNPGNSILYECVRTIMCFERESSLNVLAINILGRFLVNRDNNIRYVALNALCNAVHTNTDAIQRHRNTIVECLKDSDLTIRSRSLDLIYALFNEQNIVPLSKDLLGFLSMSNKSEIEFRQELASKICLVVQRYAPTPKWQLDTVLEVMSIIDRFNREPEVIQHLYILISNSVQLQAYITHKLYDCHVRGIQSNGLKQLICWCIGEYGYTLVDEQLCKKAYLQYTEHHTNAHESSDDDDDESGSDNHEISFEPKTEHMIIEVLEQIISDNKTSAETKAIVITALLKSLHRFPDLNEEIRRILRKYSQHKEIEIQQRSVEFLSLFDNVSNINKRTRILKPMPVPKISRLYEIFDHLEKKSNVNKNDEQDNHHRNRDSSSERDSTTDAEETDTDTDTESEDEPKKKKRNRKRKKKAITIPTIVGPEADDNTPTIIITEMKSNGQSNGKKTPVNLMEGLFGDNSEMIDGIINQSSNTITTAAAVVVDHNFDPLAEIFSNTAPAAVIANENPLKQQILAQPITAFKKNGLSVVFNFVHKENAIAGVCSVVGVFTNSNNTDISDFEFRLAVPTYIKLQIKPANGTSMLSMAKNTIVQKFQLTNEKYATKPFVIRMQMQFIVNGNKRTEQGQATFPKNCCPL